MEERLIRPYEISVWEDKLIQDGNTTRLEENKLAVIGSDTMTGLNKVYSPVFNKKSNGEKTLTFSLKYKYFDPYTGNDGVVNPFANLLVNERKVKLHYDGEWYEFIVKDHSESSDEYEWTYTCTDAFVLELSKQGYNITFDTELNNNQGTARELTQKTLVDTDWQLGSINTGKQYVAEPIYKATLINRNAVTIINASGNSDAIPGNNSSIYLFYSYVKNQDGKFVQFIIQDDNRHYTIDSKNIITDTNFRIIDELIYTTINNITGFYKINTETLIIAIDEIENRYQANRLAYNQLTTYDPVMERTVDRFKIENGDREVYKYTDYSYVTSNVIINFITNGENFNILEDGTLQGWNSYTDQSNNQAVNKLELITKPELKSGAKLVDISKLSQVEGFLKASFNGALVKENGKLYNTIYNSGIKNNISLIGSISRGDQFVFRWRAGTGNVNALIDTDKLRMVVATYTQDTPTRYGYYYKHIQENDIILDFGVDSSGNPTTSEVLNNYIKDGILEEITREEDGQTIYTGKYNYVIDNVVQVPSTKYIYVDKTNNNEYVWDGMNGNFVAHNEGINYLPYHYVIATAKKSITNLVLKEAKIGIFIYTTDNEISKTNPIYIQDIQLIRYIADSENQNKPILSGNIPTATSNSTSYYYLKPDSTATADDIETYTDINELKVAKNINENIVPLYNENSEKYLSISASQSNCFNILQTIAETFECWIDLVVGHDENGYITFTDNKPDKYVYIKEYIGHDNWAGFKYGINLQSIERTINSDELTTKLIVDQAQCDYVDSGFVSIASAKSNPSGESYLLNFDYYYNQGLLNKEETEREKNNFYTDLANVNKELSKAEKDKEDLSLALTKIESNRTVYTELISTAQEMQTDSLSDFEAATGESYEDYQSKQNDNNYYENNYYFLTNDIEIDKDKTYYTRSGNSQTGYVFTKVSKPQASSLNSYYEKLVDLSEDETIYGIIGEIYTSSSTINNYAGILTNIEQEYQEIRKKLYGSENYSVKIWTEKDNQLERHVVIELNDYLPGFRFALDSYEDSSTVNKKRFERTTNATSIRLYTPDNYYFKVDGNLTDITYTINDNEIKTFKIICNTTVSGADDKVNDLLEEKNKIIKDFNNKYSSFIQEGTWNSTDYIDSELYYLDALQVSNTSAQPTVSYTINVVEISQLEGFEAYKFDAGDKSYIEDTEFFGWSNVNIGTTENPNYILTPAREEVIVSEVEWHLEEPDKNTITVQNYKTRFEDLFQRISATVQTVQYNEATYAKTSSLLDANGNINQNVLAQSMNNLAGQEYTLTSNGAILINGDEILVQNLTNRANCVIINSEGIKISHDGGQSSTIAISGEGINAGIVTSGSINTKNILIGNEDSYSFRWDDSGISAYKSVGNGAYDLQTYVRYDEYGLYGIKNSGAFKAQNLQEVLDKAHFAVTWDGFFIKNSYEGGGRVEITSDNDFRVLNTVNQQENEKVKIGALEWDDENGQTTTNPEEGVGAPTLYGIRIKNDAGATVMQTGDYGNLTITGTINANAGNIGGMTVNSDKLTMNTIVLEPGVGIYSNGARRSNEHVFIISDVDGSATFNNITARGHIEALTGTLGQLTVQDVITVGDNDYVGVIKSKNYLTNHSGWRIDSNGLAEFQNAVIRGEINATSGVFSGNVQVGTGSPYISINGQQASIYSSNYQDGAGRGWMINKDGDAVFNNITARGAIKTAVFEYAEIQAVGGIFIFRPSSTIRSAAVNGNNLILTVEKPFLFAKITFDEVDNPTGNPKEQGWYEISQNSYNYILTEDTEIINNKTYYIRTVAGHSWCKVSNYTSDGREPNISSILVTNGLTHVYEVGAIDLATKEVTLLGAKAFIDAVKQAGETDADVLAALEGGALVDMGRESNNSDYDSGKHNYGIGINSSDNTVNLPARAISLFETTIDETQEPKVTYNYKGILGTLPTMNTGVNTSIYQHMQGTQGIFTNNMYIGDASQFVVFYEDGNGNKQLKIRANQIEFEIPDEHGQGSGQYEDIIDIAEGSEGADAIQIIITSSNGETFINGVISTRLTCQIIQGGNTDITSDYSSFDWKKYNSDGTEDVQWRRTTSVPYVDISSSDITRKAIFICEVEIGGNSNEA